MEKFQNNFEWLITMRLHIPWIDEYNENKWRNHFPFFLYRLEDIVHLLSAAVAPIWLLTSEKWGKLVVVGSNKLAEKMRSAKVQK